MSKKILWAVVSTLMVLSLAIAACGQAATPATPSTPATPAAPATPTKPVAPAAPTAPAVEKPQQEAVSSDRPQYGGTINLLQTTDLLVFDPAFGSPVTFPLTNEHLTEGDWSKGPAGTGQTSFLYAVTPQQFVIGHIAESFELPSIGTFIFKIRRGVHYALDPNSEASRLVNGRELTADDVVFSIKRLATEPRSGTRLGAPEMAKGLTVEKTGPWEVTLKTPVDPWWGYIAFFSGWSFTLQTPDIVQKYGDMNDWHRQVGTGPYMLTDYVPASTITLTRNPNYWQKNPVGPGKDDQLPYLDKVRMLIITDASTQKAVIRTAQVDWAAPIETFDAKELIKGVPKLQYSRRVSGSQAAVVIGMRLDKPALPFKDIRVRQALLMATDLKSLTDSYYAGDAQLRAWPFADTEDVHDAYVPMEQLPATVQALYTYNPDGAKKLLAEAGYPNGFKTNIIVQNLTQRIDVISAVKGMWAKVGVDLELQTKDTPSYTAISNSRGNDELIFKQAVGGLANTATMSAFRGETHWNMSFVNDAKAEAVFQEMQKNIIINQPKVLQLYRDFLPYLLEQVYVIPTPLPNVYTMWWPWVRNYHGETAIRFSGGNSWVKYVWVDKDMKHQMTGK